MPILTLLDQRYCTLYIWQRSAPLGCAASGQTSVRGRNKVGRGRLALTVDEEAQVLQDGRHESVVVAHNVEALDEGGTMVGCRRPFVKVERYGLGVEGCGLGLLEYTDAPVDVGREAVA